MWELDYKKSWAPKTLCFWTEVLEKTLESPLNRKEIQLVHPKGDQSWVFMGRTDVEAVTPILWPPDAKSWRIRKDPDAGKDWGQEEKGMTEDEMAGWHHWLNEHEFGWTPGVGDGQGGLVCCSSWGRKESDTTEWLNWTEPGPALPGYIYLSFKFEIRCQILLEVFEVTPPGRNYFLLWVLKTLTWTGGKWVSSGAYCLVTCGHFLWRFKDWWFEVTRFPLQSFQW